MIYCLAETREESPEHSVSFIISISEGVLLFAILVIGMIYLGKHGKLKKNPILEGRCQHIGETCQSIQSTRPRGCYKCHKTGGQPCNDININCSSTLLKDIK
jgi:hypothetical protein